MICHNLDLSITKRSGYSNFNQIRNGWQAPGTGAYRGPWTYEFINLILCQLPTADISGTCDKWSELIVCIPPKILFFS